jgi:chromosome segregation ATPase
MSTSPSWFDQEKFSRLVKKVGPKHVPEAAPTPSGAEPTGPTGQGTRSSQPIPRTPAEVSQASTAHISLVSKPPSLLSEHRALPTLPRRTVPLPGLKALFTSPDSTLRPPATGQIPPLTPEENAAEFGFPATGAEQNEEGTSPEQLPEEEGDLSAVWEKMVLLNEELAQTIDERDKAINEGNVLREQLQQADEAQAGQEGEAGSSEKILNLTKERDEALTEIKNLREQLGKTPEAATNEGSAEQAKEISLLTEERDQARKQYATLRNQFESLKHEQAPPREDSAKARKEMEQQLEGFRVKLEERNREIAAMKANPGAGDANAGGASNDETEKLRQDLTGLREQLQRAKDETSVAQRGLALSQKALQETRDTLREATEGTSLSRHNFDSLKGECATLAQQNTVLTAQNEQLQRDLNAVKSKLTSRL